MKPTLKKILQTISAAVIVGSLLFVLVQTIRAKNTGFEVKTLWDWMDLLIVPFVLGFGAYLLNRSERANDLKISRDRQQDALIQGYLDRMSDLLLKERLLKTDNQEVRKIARVHTLTVLRGLDGRRKGLVLQFLYEADLIIGNEPIISLHHVSLKGADLHGAYLDNANLSLADLSGADLSNAVLFGATLSGAKLIGAKMSYITLRGADLQSADLTAADMTHANLMNANLKFADLRNANLRDAWNIFNDELEETKLIKLGGAIMPDGTKHK